MSKNVMHIDAHYHGRLNRALGFGVRTFCGKKLGPDEGAPRNAPLCPKCVKKAGWDTDKRKGWQ